MVAINHGRKLVNPVLRVELAGRGDPAPVLLFIPPNGAKFDRAERLVNFFPKSRKKKIGWVTNAVLILDSCLVACRNFENSRHPFLNLSAAEIRSILRNLVLGEHHQPA